jgi:aspartate racemase
MKKIGIVGGVAWQSTVDYYSELCRRSEQLHLDRQLPGAPAMPEIGIESLDLAKAISYLGSDDDEDSWAQFDDYHRSALRRLEENGAEVGIMASNTPHHRFEAIVRGIKIPVISILREAAKESARLGARRVLLLGTTLTMRSQRFRKEFATHGIEAHGPHDEDIKKMTLELIADLQLSKFEGAAERLARIAKLSLQGQSGSHATVCLACTELPLAFEPRKSSGSFEHDGILFINATALHINAAFNFAVNG